MVTCVLTLAAMRRARARGHSRIDSGPAEYDRLARVTTGGPAPPDVDAINA